MNLAPEQEELLERFRGWLAEVGEEALRADGNRVLRAAGADVADEFAPPSYRELVEQFTALRHEVKLQTKGARQTQEAAETLSASLERALEQLQAPPPEATAESPPEILAGLMNLDDALERGRLAVEQARRRIVERTGHDFDAALEAAFARQSRWRRWASRPLKESVGEVARRQFGEGLHPALDALVEGYRLVQARLSKVLREQELERIACVGRQVDPHRMTVLEVVAEPTLPPGAVIEEVRRGYLWRGRVVRYAEVRAVARPAPPPPTTPPTQERMEYGDNSGD